MKITGIIALIVGITVLLMPGAWSWLFVAEWRHGLGMWQRYFFAMQAVIAGWSLIRHPRPVATVIVMAAFTPVVLAALAPGHAMYAAGLMLVQAAVLWMLHRGQKR